MKKKIKLNDANNRLIPRKDQRNNDFSSVHVKILYTSLILNHFVLMHGIMFPNKVHHVPYIKS